MRSASTSSEAPQKRAMRHATALWKTACPKSAMASAEDGAPRPWCAGWGGVPSVFRGGGGVAWESSGRAAPGRAPAGRP